MLSSISDGLQAAILYSRGCQQLGPQGCSHSKTIELNAGTGKVPRAKNPSGYKATDGVGLQPAWGVLRTIEAEIVCGKQGLELGPTAVPRKKEWGSLEGSEHRPVRV